MKNKKPKFFSIDYKIQYTIQESGRIIIKADSKSEALKIYEKHKNKLYNISNQCWKNVNNIIDEFNKNSKVKRSNGSKIKQSIKYNVNKTTEIPLCDVEYYINKDGTSYNITQLH
jgi:hypothetical protein